MKRILLSLTTLFAISTSMLGVNLERSAQMKADDPHGFGISVLCMGVVFSCLAILFVFFKCFGFVADRRNKIAAKQPIKPIVKTGKKINEVRHATSTILQDGTKTKGRDKEIYIAVISMALKQYLNDVHDIESGIISIKPRQSAWGAHNNFNNTTERK